MKRFKIVIGIVVLILLAFAVSKGFKSAETSKSNVEQKLTKAQQLKAKEYAFKQIKLKKSVAAYFEKEIQADVIVGAGVSIVQGDSILISGGFGKRKSDEKNKIDEETIFRIGSLSKGFGGVLTASFQAEHKLNWNDKITDYIPEFQLGDSANTAKITVSHLLSHSSGAPYHSFTNLVEANLPIADIVKRFHEVKPQNKPGLQYSYQNAMFALSQEVLHKVSGQDVKTLLQNRFFTPLGMSTVSMNHESLIKNKNVAMPHAKGNKGWRTLPLRDRYYNAVVAGGINASANDMAKWMRLLMGHKPEVLKKEVIAEVFKPMIALRDNNKYYQRWPGHLQSHYGFGWRIHKFQDVDDKKEFTIWHHGGSVNNFRNEIAIFPEVDIGICVLLNGNSKLASTVIPDLYTLVKEHLNP